MNYAQNVTLFHEMISCGHELYYTVLDQDFALRDTSCPFARFFPVLLRDQDAYEHALMLSQGGPPFVFSASSGLMCIIDCLRGDAGDIQYHLIGPVFVEDVPRHQLEESLSALGFSGAEKRVLSGQLAVLPLFPINHFLDYGLMQHYCLTGEKIDLNAFAFIGSSSDVEKANRSPAQSSFHGTWAMEQELMRLIEEGNPDYKHRAAQLIGNGQMAPLGNGDTLRHIKNITIIFTSLCTRAAIRGGLAPEVSYSLSDSYILRIEAARSFDEVARINDAMQDDYVGRVHAARTGASTPLVQKLLYYIDVHLEEDLRVSALARLMGCSESYLARVFRNETGMTISEHIRRRRIQLARDALLNGSEPVQSICHRLGFESHSYFTEQFKKETGVTPTEFRNKNGKTGDGSLS